MNLKIFSYLTLGTLNVVVLVLVSYFVSNESVAFRYDNVIFLFIAIVAAILEMFTTFKIIQILNKRISEPAKDLSKALNKYFETGEMAINPGKLPQEYNETVELLNRITNTLETIKKSNIKARELLAKKTEELNTELEIQKAATIKVLKEIDAEKEISKAQARELEKFQMAVAEANDHIVITDKEGNILYSNPSVERITGYSIQETLGTKAGKLWGGQMTKDFYEDMWTTIKINKKVYKSEITNLRKDGSPYFAEISISPILDENKDVIFYVSIQRDITKAKEVDRMKTEFISLASHQLRAPLAAIRWNLETLQDKIAGELTPQQSEFAKEAYDSTTRMVDLVNGLLNVSRIESGRLIIEPTLTNLSDLIITVLKEINIMADKKRQVLHVDIQQDIPDINIDPKLIRNVYLNFLTNAIKYTPEEGTIELDVRIQGTNIVSRIKDNGYGIPKEQQSKIFKKFFRADNARKFDTDGTGLGLYLVKAIIEASNGKVWFESIENLGTTFYFTIPLAGMPAKSGEVSIEG